MSTKENTITKDCKLIFFTQKKNCKLIITNKRKIIVKQNENKKEEKIS